MLDELFEFIVDELCERVPRFVRPRFTALAASPLGWRVNLYAGTAVRAVSSLLRRVHTDEGLEEFMRETMERRTGFYALRRVERGSASALARARAFCETCRFPAALFLTLLAACGVLARGGGRLALCAAALCLWWLSVSMEEDYPPVARGVRQRYIAAALLRGACQLPLLFMFFREYVRLGVRSNVILQSAMVVMIFVHLAFFLPLVAFNRRQMPFLRALAGVLGVLPALTAAAAVSAVFSSAGRGGLAGAALGALGALLVFAGDQTGWIVGLGGIRLRGQRLYRALFETLGFLLVLAGAWLPAAF